MNGDRAPRRYWCAALFPLLPRWLLPVAGLALAALLAPVNGGGGVASAETTIYSLNAGGGRAGRVTTVERRFRLRQRQRAVDLLDKCLDHTRFLGAECARGTVPNRAMERRRRSANDLSPAGSKWVVPGGPLLRGDLARSVHKRRASVQRRSQRQARPHPLRHLRGGGRQYRDGQVLRRDDLRWHLRGADPRRRSQQPQDLGPQHCPARLDHDHAQRRTTLQALRQAQRSRRLRRPRLRHRLQRRPFLDRRAARVTKDP